MSHAAIAEEGVACRPNISPAGVRRRRRWGWSNVAIGVALLVALGAVHARWYWRLTLFFPGALAAIGFLQARRKTCVSRAAEGRFENDDFSTTKAPDDDVSRSRAVAATINRDSLLVGFLAAALGALTAAL